MESGDALGLLDIVLSLCKTIYNMVENVKANKQFCQQLAEKVKSLEELVLTINKRSGRISSALYKALKKLRETLNSAQNLMMDFSKIKAFSSFIMSSSLKEKFQNMDKRLTDDLCILSGALLIEQGNVVHKLYDTVNGRRRSPTRPTTTTPPPSIETPISATVPTATMPVSCIMSLTQMYRPMTPVPVSGVMTPMPVCGFMAPMALPGTMTLFSFSTTIISKSTTVSPRLIKTHFTSQSVINLNQLFSTKSIMRSFEVNHFFDS